MRRARLWTSAGWLALALAAPAAAQSVDELAWLAGDWRSDDGETLVQEVWTDPRAGSMTGMFRLVRGGEVMVLEYVVLTEVGGGVYYQFKHFRPDYTTWEGVNPPIRMKLVESGPGRAVFRNTREVEGQPSYISYLLGDDGRITVLVGEAPTEAGEYQGIRFVLARTSNQEARMPADQSINYVELPARDLDAVQRFYQGAFGWTFTDYGPEYRAFNDGAFDGGFRKMDASSTTSSGAALVILYAEDLERTRETVLQHGGILVRDIFSFPGGRRFHFTDPNGNELAVWSDR